MYVCTIVCVTLEVDSVSQLSYLVVHSLLGLLQSLIASVTLSFPENSAVSQARRLATPPYDISVNRSAHAHLNQDVNKHS